jgi:hypothetical protein
MGQCQGSVDANGCPMKAPQAIRWQPVRRCKRTIYKRGSLTLCKKCLSWEGAA